MVRVCVHGEGLCVHGEGLCAWWSFVFTLGTRIVYLLGNIIMNNNYYYCEL